MPAPLTADSALTPREAACVTGVPLERVQRAIASGLFGDAANDETLRIRGLGALAGLKLAHQTRDRLSPEAQRRMVRYLVDHPDAATVREGETSVDVAAIRDQVRERLALLTRARDMVMEDPEIMGGRTCFSNTRVPVHLIAGMILAGDTPEGLVEHYPTVPLEQLRLASIYAEAYPDPDKPTLTPEQVKQKRRTWIEIRMYRCAPD